MILGGSVPRVMVTFVSPCLLEDRTAADWLREIGGEGGCRVVWEPLLRGKFGDLAEEAAAVWFWNKLKLRGGSRGRGDAASDDGSPPLYRSLKLRGGSRGRGEGTAGLLPGRLRNPHRRAGNPLGQRTQRFKADSSLLTFLASLLIYGKPRTPSTPAAAGLAQRHLS